MGRVELLEGMRREGEFAMGLGPADHLHSILGWVAGLAGDRLGAAEHHRRAYVFDPYPDICFAIVARDALLPAGRIGEAVRIADDAIEALPASGMAKALRALCACLGGDFAMVRRLAETSPLLRDPIDHLGIDVVRSEEACNRGAIEEAVALLVDVLARPAALPGAGGVLRQAYEAFSGTGSSAAASEALEVLFGTEDRTGAIWRQFHTPGLFLRWQARLGNLDAAFAVARRIVEQWRETGLLSPSSLIPMWAFDMAPFRRDHRFQPLVGEFGLFRFWEVHGPPDGYALRSGELVEL